MLLLLCGRLLATACCCCCCCYLLLRLDRALQELHSRPRLLLLRLMWWRWGLQWHWGELMLLLLLLLLVWRWWYRWQLLRLGCRWWWAHLCQRHLRMMQVTIQIHSSRVNWLGTSKGIGASPPLPCLLHPHPRSSSSRCG
jgi:hypothetical protein